MGQECLIFRFFTVWNNASSTAAPGVEWVWVFPALIHIACLGAFKKVCLNPKNILRNSNSLSCKLESNISVKTWPYRLLYRPLICTSPKPAMDIASESFKCCGFKQWGQGPPPLALLVASWLSCLFAKIDTWSCVMGLLEASLNWHISLKCLSLQHPTFQNTFLTTVKKAHCLIMREACAIQKKIICLRKSDAQWLKKWSCFYSFLIEKLGSDTNGE